MTEYTHTQTHINYTYVHTSYNEPSRTQPQLDWCNVPVCVCVCDVRLYVQWWCDVVVLSLFLSLFSFHCVCVRTRPCLQERILSRARNRSNLAVPYSSWRYSSWRYCRRREVLASRVPVYGTKDAGRGLWLRLKYTCKQSTFSLNQFSADSVHASRR